MRIYVECKTDSTLVNALLGTAKKDIAHEKGKPGVCNRLQNIRGCRGMVDEDPKQKQHPYLRKLKVKEELRRYGLRLLYDPLTGNELIVIRPSLEAWILSAVNEVGLNTSKYQLSENPSTFHRDVNVSQNEFRRLVRDLKNSNRLKNLKRLLERRR